MRKLIGICLTMPFLITASLWAADDQSSQQPSSPDYDEMGPGMMGSGSGYYGRGPGMMGYGGHMGYGRGGSGQGMGPGRQGWQDMSPEQQEKWRQMRSQFLQETLPLRQDLQGKQLELQTLWDQRNPDMDKIRTLSDQIADLQGKLHKKNNEYLTQCRKEFGDLGWSCPGGGWTGN